MTDITRIIPHIFAEPRQTAYVVLDAARNKAIYPALLESKAHYHCLYAGTISPALKAAAPYLVRLEKDHPFTSWIIEKAWGNSWGVFLQSPADLENMRRHFRRFLIVKDHRGKKLYFRYYDPRVLRVFLPTCDYDQLYLMFGPISHYYVEGEDPAILIEYAFKEMRLEWRFINLKLAVEPKPQKIKNAKQLKKP